MERIRRELSLCNISLGTMRFVDKDLKEKEVLDLIERSYDMGINVHHSSYEYNSYELYVKTLKKVSCRSKIKHISKISSPHFDEDKFSFNTLEKRVDEQLKKMDIERIDILQWLVRSQPISDIKRIKILIEQLEEINNAIDILKRKGKISLAFSFPYSKRFAEEIIKLNVVDGIISYLNKEETEYSELAKGIPFIGIRPLFGGSLLKENKESSILDCFKYIEEHECVLTSVVSINSLDQLKVYEKIIK